MKYLKLFESYKRIESICEEYGIRNYTINNDESVDVNDNVHILNKTSELGIKFRHINGGFIVSDLGLISCKGFPETVSDTLNCSRNNIKSLYGCTQNIPGAFFCRYNQLTNLQYGPKTIQNSYNCSNNKINTLEYSPDSVGGNFYCNNNEITSLKGCVIPGDFFSCESNPLPEEFISKLNYIRKIIKYQDDYSIWNQDGTLNKFRFDELMGEIKGL